MIRTKTSLPCFSPFHFACLLFCCSCFAGPFSAAAADSPPPATLGISLKEVNNFIYNCPGAGDLPAFAFKNGTFKQENGSSDDPSMVTMANIVNAAFGKLLPGDQQEAAVVFVYNGGGSGWFYELTVLTKRNGKLTQLGCTELGDRVQIDAMEIKNKQIVLDVTTHGPDDPACCPTVHRTVRYAPDNGQLMEQQQP